MKNSLIAPGPKNSLKSFLPLGNGKLNILHIPVMPANQGLQLLA